VTAVDANALGEMPADVCDVLMMTRASYMIEDPAAFLRDTWRMIRPGGLFLIDWVHGAAEKAALDLPDAHEYAGRAYPFLTTYCGADAVGASPAEFGALVRDAERRSFGWRVSRLLDRGRRNEMPVARYLDELRARLASAGKHLVEPATIAPTFKVL